MGNSALRDLAVIETADLGNWDGDVVAVDAHQYLYRYMTATVRYMDEDIYTTDDGTEVANLVGLLQGLPGLLSASITPLFVFDGSSHEKKDAEIEERKAAKEEAAEKMAAAAADGNTEAVRRYKAQTQRLTETVHETSRQLLSELGIPYVEADGEGEALAATLAQTGHAAGVMTDDYDALLFGSPTTIRNYSGNGSPEQMQFTPTLKRHGITHRQLIDVALLCGTDYCDGVSGIGPKRGIKYIKQHGDAETVLDEKGGAVEDLDTLRDLFLDPPVGSVPDTQPARKPPDFTGAVNLARRWGLPHDFIRKRLKQFPRS
jgi:flap endonuclease-1